MNQTSSDTHHEDMALLLPWYVNNTLSDAERVQVEAHLASCGECDDALRQLQSIAVAVGNEPTAPLVPEPPVDAFMRTLDDSDVKKTAARPAPRIWAMAASVLVLVAAGMLVYTGQRSVEPNQFETVTNPAADIAYVFTVDYTGDDWEQDRTNILSVVPGAVLMPNGDTYRLEVTMPSKTVRELDALAETLRTIEGIEQVTLVGVQLPIE